MSFLSGHTKKVSVYGRKAEVRVVNRHNTFTALGTDENDPFGFFNAQTKPKSTYGRSRALILPPGLLSRSIESEDEDKDDALESHSAIDESAQYETADSSRSFHSACSASSPKATKATPATTAKSGSQRRVLANKPINIKEQKGPTRSQSPSKPVQAKSRQGKDERSVVATPKASRSGFKRSAVDSPKTIRKPTRPSSSIATLPNESTPPPIQTSGRAPRRAAQAARSAIEDYDFTDRDMTPRRPVPTKSYFVEKARQLAEWALEDEMEELHAKTQAKGKDHMSGPKVGKARKSMAVRPRQTSSLGTIKSTAIAISDSSLSSVTSLSQSSFDGSSQSSFTLIIPCSDDPCGGVSKRSAAAKSKSKQNKRATRRIAATSDDEGDVDGRASSDEGSDNEDPTAKLAAQVADLEVSESPTSSDGHLSELLAAVSQTKPEAFSEAVQRLRTTSKTSRSRRRLEKIGEASYSEVFKIFAPSSAKASEQEALVLKIIPIADPYSSSSTSEDDDLPYTSPASDVEREIRLMQLVARESTTTDAFVALRSAHVVRGAYPAPLLQAWDRWDTKRRVRTGEGAENIRPDVLGSRQAYALLVMTDGGMDLESLKVKSWMHAASIFWQVVVGLGTMESKYQFEHRDLHWGNILVQNISSELSPRATKDEHKASTPSWLLNPDVSGVKATIIDFTLSRATIPAPTKGRSKKGEVLHYPCDDETLFEGSGDPQFEVYREMRLATKGDWQNYCPDTNTLWLRYLAHKLIDVKCKTCKVPKASTAGGDVEAQREEQAYNSLHAAAERLDSSAQAILQGSTGLQRLKKGAAGRKSMHSRARKSVLPPVTGGVRKGRATMMVAPLIPEEDENGHENVHSAAQLMKLLER